MLNLFSLKKEANESNSEPTSTTKGGSGKGKGKQSAAQLRITKDLNEMDLPKTCEPEFPDPDDLLNFRYEFLTHPVP